MPAKSASKTNNKKTGSSSKINKKTSMTEDNSYMNFRRANSRTRVLNINSTEKSCSKGQISRSAYVRPEHARKSYVRSDGTRVKASSVKRSTVTKGCVEDLGRPGKGVKLFELEKDVLKPFGYKHVKDLTKLQRQKALKRALNNGIKPLSLYRRVRALSTLNSIKDPQLAEIFKNDSDYIKTTKEYTNRKTTK